LVSEQYGFREGMSIDNAAYKLTDSILKAWNKQMHVGGMFCDLAKVFDCVNCEILLLKLQHCGILGVNADWFRSYLSNRKQRVELKTNTAQIYHSS
jgi:hypothetical protein